MNEPQQPVSKHNSRGEARRRAMLDATWQILSEKGFAAVTLNDVISRSGGSRTTLYEAFGGKDGLIASVLTEKCQEFCETLQTSLRSDRPAHEALLNFTIIMTEKGMDDESLRIMNFLQIEMQQFPEIRETFLKNGPDIITQRVTDFFANHTENGTLNVVDPDFTARMLLTMIHGQWRDILVETMPPYKPTQEEIAQRAKQLVDLVLNGVLPRTA
ncbi:TetR/AcrR family transcriptional regulator [Thalassospira sp. TSL5-1]|uniref:TetR/AcrR family transcriptional regulator n=1 Tax=Thalassospira sp. TSL5-1 TaxID=1544451 RepID=UPI00093E574E|nr:TetR/AcrR family transcriptional regulator [Thalassospira sp. TSL5-1]OKH89158.1 hypothetical protein LF95_03675 [Thalassospira sp. TSL5-1]